MTVGIKIHGIAKSTILNDVSSINFILFLNIRWHFFFFSFFLFRKIFSFLPLLLLPVLVHYQFILSLPMASLIIFTRTRIIPPNFLYSPKYTMDPSNDPNSIVIAMKLELMRSIRRLINSLKPFLQNHETLSFFP